MRLLKRKSTKQILSIILSLGVILTLIFVLKKTAFPLGSFSAILFSLILEAFPFILFGTLLAAVVEVYVSERFVDRIKPKNFVLGLIFASFGGLLIPVCECGIVPFVSKLHKKGMPIPYIVTFLLAAPIVNPITILSTYVAFPNHFHFVYLRVFCGLGIAILIGYIFSKLSRKDFLKENVQAVHTHKANTFSSVLFHTTREFFVVGKYFLIGALLASMIHVIVSVDILAFIGNNKVLSVVSMMLFAFVSSVCSEADAFIANTFTPLFSTGSILAFIVFGAMMDLKNFILLKSYFKNAFVIMLLVLTVVLNLVVMVGINYVGGML